VKVVIDARLTLNWFFADERDAADARALHHVRENGALVPPIWNTELTNALVVAERRGRIDGAQISAIVDDLRALPIEVEVAGAAPRFSEIALARKHGLTAYDAAYLDLALRYSMPLATSDEILAKAASEYALLWESPRR
jgi:predicted nucleic acid-binding protein